MPAPIQRQKVVGALPATLQPDTEYLVRTGDGYDSYLTNHSGTIIAYPLNSRPGLRVPQLVAPGLWITPALVSNSTGNYANSLGDLRLTLFSPTRTFQVDQLAIITTGTTSGGTNAARLVIYSTATNGWPDVPLISPEITGLNATGTFTATLNTPFTFQAGLMYWIGIHSDFTNTHRQLTNTGLPNLGYKAVSNTTGNLCINRNTPYANGLPTPFNFTINDLVTYYVTEVRMRVV